MISRSHRLSSEMIPDNNMEKISVLIRFYLSGARGLPLQRSLTGDELRPTNKLSVANPMSD